VGGLLAQTSVQADGPVTVASSASPERRCRVGVAGRWRGGGSYGAGLAAFPQAPGERVVEVGRPRRPPRRSGAKSDALDAVRAARAALRVPLATRHGACAAKVGAINQLEALIVAAPEELRAELRGLGTKRQVTRCAGLWERPARSLEHRMTVRALRSTAQPI
jgi:transposase